MYLLEMTLNLLLCGFRFFMHYWTRLAQMSKKNRQNGHGMLETSFKVGLQPEGAPYHSETVIN